MKVTKSRNFDTNLDADRMQKQIKLNTQQTLEEAEEGANSIAPLDMGALRQSSSIHITSNGGYIEWDVPYANKVYHKNNKNPQTTEWDKKDYDRNKAKYLATMKEDIIK